MNKRIPKDAEHPMQPLVRDEHGVVRFKRNAIVEHLLKHGGIDMNAIARLPFDDRAELAAKQPETRTTLPEAEWSKIPLQHESGLTTWNGKRLRDLSAAEFDACKADAERGIGSMEALIGVAEETCVRLALAKAAQQGQTDDEKLVAKEKAAGELLRAAKELAMDAMPIEKACFAVGNYVLDDLRTAIEGAERAGIGKN